MMVTVGSHHWGWASAVEMVRKSLRRYGSCTPRECKEQVRCRCRGHQRASACSPLLMSRGEAVPLARRLFSANRRKPAADELSSLVLVGSVKIVYKWEEVLSSRRRYCQ